MTRAMAAASLAGLLLVLATNGSAQSIAGSFHDFSGDGWNATGEICVVCHTPHNAVTTEPVLWNHQVTAATFTVYSSATLDATVGQPDGSSKLCLSCHDGTVAVDNFGATTTGTQVMSGGDALGTDLSNDHPVSFLYDAALALADGGVSDPTVAASGLGGTISADMLFAGKVQCATCHDVHNGSGLAMLLVKSNASSALCLTCHTK